MNNYPDVDIDDEDNPELSAQDVARMRPGALVLPASTSRFQVYSEQGEWRWRLSAANGRVLATSEGYRSRQQVLNAIEQVRQAMGASVVET
jgi:uncharacterized protein YegP (UPF0339 family)